jgi:hypothetical protein
MVRYTKRISKLASYECKAASFAAEPNFWFVRSSDATVLLFCSKNEYKKWHFVAKAVSDDGCHEIKHACHSV